jgi:hypothetical protein
MPAGKHTSAEATVTFDGVDITQHITKINGIEIEGAFEESTPLGAALRRSEYGGVLEVKDIEIEGLYDDTNTTGPHAKFNTVGQAAGLNKALVFGWGNSKTTTVTVHVRSYNRSPEVGKPTAFKAVLTNAGASITEA